jgi:GNAT superfamily N-acetyltransferase
LYARAFSVDLAWTVGQHLEVTRMTAATLIRYSDKRKPTVADVVDLYRSVAWSSADKPDALHAGLLASHSLVTGWDAERLVGLGNAISDGHLVVYFPHLVVRPDYQGRGIGTELMRRMLEKYRGFHQQALLADGRAIEFYKRLGFSRAGATEPLWIFDGHEHD